MAKPAASQSGAAERKLRCAIYTRKSTEEGLEQDFNSLDAQREACAAYILSQRHEGWMPVANIYDDGGYSGGNMERPALKALMAEVAAGKVDVIVVYKVDRLTRSLADFAKIVEVLDAAKASFVSVTQSFNTTTSMGRLTLNVLLSFAQFEREVTGERIRDKIAASKARGMWMGGPIPLGYDLADRKLVVNDAEAATVRHLFTRYLELGSGRLLVAELDRQSIRSKPRTNRDGTSYGARPISRGALYAILSNRLYVGQVMHKSQCYRGQHDAIIDGALFEQVQQKLADRSVERRHGTNATEPSLLAGLIVDGHGRCMSPSHAVKQGLRYRYYVSQADGEAASSQAVWRISASDIETLVLTKLRTAIEQAVVARIAVGDLNAEKIVELTGASGDTLAILGERLGVAAARPGLLRLVHEIKLDEQHVSITLNLSAVHPMLEQGNSTETAQIGFVRRGTRVRLIIPPAGDGHQRPSNPAMVKLVVRAIAARHTITDGASLAEAAERLSITRAYLVDLLRVSYLAPSIISAILDGRQPASLSRKQLIQACQVPLHWTGQQRMFGFA